MSVGLQFGHGLLCRGNSPSPVMAPPATPRFNSATACYAVETLICFCNRSAISTASIRPRLVMPWKLGTGGGRHREAVRDASIRPRLVMPWKQYAPIGRTLAEVEASIRPRLVMPWKQPQYGKHRRRGRSASIRPRLVMPWKLSHITIILTFNTLQFGHGLLCRGNSL